MKIYTLYDVVRLGYKYSDIINFGTADDAVDDVVIETAEKALGLQFTSSYKDFLKNYKGGDISGEEILSLYDRDFTYYPVGDIVYRNFKDIENGVAKPQQLVVSKTALSETFYFDYSQFKDGECPLYIRFPSGDSEYYASNFCEFLCKRIKAHAE
ncbi:SMI1/KNR4 family protein [Bartonella sp. B30(2025)]